MCLLQYVLQCDAFRNTSVVTACVSEIGLKLDLSAAAVSFLACRYEELVSLNGVPDPGIDVSPMRGNMSDTGISLGMCLAFRGRCTKYVIAGYSYPN